MKLPSRVPRATYRVQLHAHFTFDDLAAIVPYLNDLGISDVYLSPIFRAAAGSTHGYDVCDHNEVSPELGGLEGLHKVSRLLKERSMGMVVDFVPNHMGIEGPFNWRWMDVLEHGRHSRYASFFDIAWNPRQTSLQDRIIIPLLHDFYGRVLEAGEIKIQFINGAFWACYRTLQFPLCPKSYGMVLQRLAWLKTDDVVLSQNLETLAVQFQTLSKFTQMNDSKEIEEANQARDGLHQKLSWLIEEKHLSSDLDQILKALNGRPHNPDSFDSLHQILEEQNYRLAYWKTGTHEINYRRFFAIDTLVGLRMGNPEVFEESHRLLKDLIRQDIVSGVRVDHIDGLWNPGEYLQRLSGLASSVENPFYLLVEKILAEKEELPADWMTHGTTGYDFSANLINVLIDSKAENEFTRIYREFAGITINPDEQAYRIKLYIMDELFPNTLDNFALDLELHVKSDRRWRDWTVNDLRPALSRIIACLSVYRTYRVAGELPTEHDIDVVERAVTEALRLNPSSDPQTFYFIRDLLTGRYPDEKAGPELKVWADNWISGLQQYTGAIMAKSVEDTFFYQYVRLFAANEVGHHPGEFGSSLADFHEKNQTRLQKWPATMLATSTHDTKVSEDVRARLLALSEIPARWDEVLHQWSKLNHTAKIMVKDRLVPDANEEYLLYQILLGAWPLQDKEIDATFSQRIKPYMRKALSEAKVHTNWANSNESWLDACDQFIDTILDRKKSSLFLASFVPFAEHIARQGMKMALIQIALKLTLPGVPDFYQGTELWDFSLVDPDNRRPVDYIERQDLFKGLAQVPLSELMDSWKDGRIKMRLISTLLGLRREHESLFLKGTYTPLKISGPAADRFIAFLRSEGNEQLLVLALRRLDKNGITELPEIGKGMSVSLPTVASTWCDLLTGRKVTASSMEVSLKIFFGKLPLAVFRSI